MFINDWPTQPVTYTLFAITDTVIRGAKVINNPGYGRISRFFTNICLCKNAEFALKCLSFWCSFFKEGLVKSLTPSVRKAPKFEQTAAAGNRVSPAALLRFFTRKLRALE